MAQERKRKIKKYRNISMIEKSNLNYKEGHNNYNNKALEENSNRLFNKLIWG